MIVTMTGASGFTGPRIIERLIEQGHELRLLGRKRPPALSANIRFFPWDAMAAPPPVESIDGADALIHMAGEPVAQRWNDDVKRRIRASRVTGTNNLVRAISAVTRRPKVLVAASASGFYGDRGDEVLTEKAGPGAGFLADVCVEWEREARAAEAFGLRVALLRISIVLGVGGGALDRMLPPFKAGIGGRIGSGRQWMPWIHVEDLAALAVHALNTESARGALNASAPEPVRNAEFTAALAEALHRPAGRAPVRRLYDPPENQPAASGTPARFRGACCPEAV